MIPLCRYILQGGNQCQQAAINGEYYCRHHLVVRRTVAAAAPKPNPYQVEKTLPLIFPEDRAALQIDIFFVMQAFNEGDISPKRANIFTRLLHECSINLKQGPLYETNHEHAVRSVVVTPEGEEIAPAREVPEAGETVSAEAASEAHFAQTDETASGEEVGNETVSEPAGQQVSAENPEAVPQTSKGGLCGPPTDEAGTQGDFACNDPCYIANLTERREQYRAFALNDLAAGRDPRTWEDFIPGKSRMRKPKPLAG